MNYPRINSWASLLGSKESKSLSCLVPQSEHVHVRSERVNSLLIPPHEEQVLELGSKVLILNRFFPYQLVLYSSMLKNLPRLRSWICRASLWFFKSPLMLRVSTHSVWFSRTKLVETLWRKSFLWFDTRSCKRANLTLTRLELLEPFFLRLKDFWSLLSLDKDVLRNLGLSIISPLEQVAKVLIPTSMPMALLIRGLGFIGAIVPSSTKIETKYL